MHLLVYRALVAHYDTNAYLRSCPRVKGALFGDVRLDSPTAIPCCHLANPACGIDWVRGSEVNGGASDTAHFWLTALVIRSTCRVVWLVES